ncbi:hypothetical protein ACJMK2_006420, partial [Sinanodonta woodiana]
MENTTTNINTGGRVQLEPLTVASKGREKGKPQIQTTKHQEKIRPRMGKIRFQMDSKGMEPGRWKRKKDRTQGGSSSTIDRQPTGETETKQT